MKTGSNKIKRKGAPLGYVNDSKKTRRPCEHLKKTNYFSVGSWE